MHNGNFRPECPVCAEPYTAEEPHEPRLLMCGHSLCHSCAAIIAHRTLRSGDAPILVCPMCRTQSPIPASVPDGEDPIPPKNFSMIELLAALRSMPPPRESPVQEEEEEKEEEDYVSDDDDEEEEEEAKADGVIHVSKSFDIDDVDPVFLAPNEYPAYPVKPAVPEAPPAVSPSAPEYEEAIEVPIGGLKRDYITIENVVNSFALVSFVVQPQNVWSYVEKWFRESMFTPKAAFKEAQFHGLKPILVPMWKFSVCMDAVVVGTNRESGGIESRFQRTFRVEDRQFVVCADEDLNMRICVKEHFKTAWNKSLLMCYDPHEAKREKPKPDLFARFLNFFSPKEEPKKLFIPPQTEIRTYIPAEAFWLRISQSVAASLQKQCERESSKIGSIVSKRINVGEGRYRAELFYVPVYGGCYTYKGEDYTFAVNGETGVCGGRLPEVSFVSGMRKMVDFFMPKEEDDI